MKNLNLVLITLMLLLGTRISFAKQAESRLKIQSGGKEIITSLNSVSTSISRYEDEPARTGVVKGAVKD